MVQALSHRNYNCILLSNRAQEALSCSSPLLYRVPLTNDTESDPSDLEEETLGESGLQRHQAALQALGSTDSEGDTRERRQRRRDDHEQGRPSGTAVEDNTEEEEGECLLVNPDSGRRHIDFQSSFLSGVSCFRQFLCMVACAYCIQYVYSPCEVLWFARKVFTDAEGVEH